MQPQASAEEKSISTSSIRKSQGEMLGRSRGWFFFLFRGRGPLKAAALGNKSLGER